jgi:hypothetical protein
MCSYLRSRSTMDVTYLGTSPDFSIEDASPLFCEVFTVAGRFGSPITSITCVGVPGTVFELAADC